MALYVDKETGHALSMSPQSTLRFDQVEANAGMLLMNSLIGTDLLHLKEVYEALPIARQLELKDEVEEEMARWSQGILDFAVSMGLHNGKELVTVKEWLESQEETPATDEEAEALFLDEYAENWYDLLADVNPPEWD